MNTELVLFVDLWECGGDVRIKAKLFSGPDRRLSRASAVRVFRADTSGIRPRKAWLLSLDSWTRPRCSARVGKDHRGTEIRGNSPVDAEAALTKPRSRETMVTHGNCSQLIRPAQECRELWLGPARGSSPGHGAPGLRKKHVPSTSLCSLTMPVSMPVFRVFSDHITCCSPQQGVCSRSGSSPKPPCRGPQGGRSWFGRMLLASQARARQLLWCRCACYSLERSSRHIEAPPASCSLL